MRVLVVEDEAIVALDIAQTLERSGHEIVAQTAFGEHVPDLVSQHAPDALLMDVRLAGDVDGIESARRVHRVLDVPIVFLTAYSDERTLERLRPLATAVLVKPFDQRELPAALRVAVERHELLRRARRRSRELTVTLESIAEAVAVTDASGAVEYLNPAAETLSSWSAAEAEGRPLSEVFPLLRGDGTPMDDPALSALTQQGTVYLPPDIRLRRRDGTMVPVGDSAAPLVDGPDTYGTVVVLRDRTDEVRSAQIQARQDRLVALGRLVATVAHEIASPLTYALINCEQVREEIATESASAERIESWGRLLGDVQHGLEVIATVVQGMRSLGVAGTLPTEAVPLAPLVRRSAEMAVLDRKAQGEISLTLDPAATVTGNADRLGQLVRNLVVNALDACGRRADAVRIVLSEALDGQVELVVEDDGCGIPAETLARVFDPFFTTKTFDRGMGLGLAVVQRIVEEHEGRIDVESEPDRGTRFLVRLPSATPLDEAAPRRPSVGPRAGLRILLVDDDDLVRRSVQYWLTADHQVVAAASAEEAERQIDADPSFDVVICDVMMPKRSGLELFDELRRRHPALVERFAFFTGGSLEERLQARLDALGRPVLHKPCTKEELGRFLVDLTTDDGSTAP